MNNNSVLKWLLRSFLLGVVLFLVAIAYATRVDLHSRIQEKIGGPSIAFIGDSVTAGGGVWDWRLGNRLSFQTKNFGQGSAGLQVISWIAKVRVIPLYKIKTVSIMAGTNDGPSTQGTPLSYGGNANAVLASYYDLIDYFRSKGVEKIVITSTPPGSNEESNRIAFIRRSGSG